MKRILSFFLLAIIFVNLLGCTNVSTSSSVSVEDMDWTGILKEAKGKTVNLYGWGGSDVINTWLDKEVAESLKKQYDITLNRVPMNIDEILNKLLSEKQLNTAGTIDVVWINGENFYTAKSADLLYGPFTAKLPNFNAYVDATAPDIAYDFGYPVEGYEAPYGKAQFVLIGDSAVIGEIPVNHIALMDLAKANPGKISYPAPPDFTGSAFVRNIIYDIVGYEAFMTVAHEKEAVRKLIQPALDYLVELKPYLWRQGETYPAANSQVDNMYSDGELMMTMNYNPNHVAVKILSGEFSATSIAGIFNHGSIGNTHFLAIPGNTQNKAAALAFINHILSPEIQASKYHPDNWGDLPVLDESKLSAEQIELFRSIPKGPGVPQLDQLLTKRLPEMPSALVPIIEELWMETVPVKGD
jgi:putative spermidine/putrescine transport system substrate-binding protein